MIRCNHRRGREQSSAVTVCHHCRDFLCSICGVTIEWYEELRVANPGIQWRYCARDACVEVEAAYHALPFDEMIRHRGELRGRRVLAHLQDRGLEPRPPLDQPLRSSLPGGAQLITIAPRPLTPRPGALGPGEACWCNLGKDCAGDHEIGPVEVVNVCGFCGQELQFSSDDPHWSTGRGPICPMKRKPSP